MKLTPVIRMCRLFGLFRLTGACRLNVVSTLVLMLAAIAVSIPAYPEEENLQETIIYLVRYVKTSDVTFIRNGREHSPEDAAEHIMKKYNHFKKKIETPEDFIRLSATKSTMSGRAYMIRTGAGETMTSAEWLTRALEEYRKAKNAPHEMAEATIEGGATEVKIEAELPCPGSYVCEMKTFEKKSGDCTDPYSDCVAVTLHYPDVDGTPARASKDSVNAFVRAFILKSSSGEKIFNDPNKLADEFIGGYEDVKKDIPDYSTGWFLERSVEIIHNTLEVLSLVSTETSFTGGAHPNSMTTFTSFDMVTGSQVALHDVLMEDAVPKLSQVAEKHFREVRQLKDDQSLSDAGFWFAEDKFSLNDNFAVCCEGLIFYFNRYEITSYADGPTRLILPYTEIKDLIRKERKTWFEEG